MKTKRASQVEKTADSLRPGEQIRIWMPHTAIDTKMPRYYEGTVASVLTRDGLAIVGLQPGTGAYFDGARYTDADITHVEIPLSCIAIAPVLSSYFHFRLT